MKIFKYKYLKIEVKNSTRVKVTFHHCTCYFQHLIWSFILFYYFTTAVLSFSVLQTKLMRFDWSESFEAEHKLSLILSRNVSATHSVPSCLQASVVNSISSTWDTIMKWEIIMILCCEGNMRRVLWEMFLTLLTWSSVHPAASHYHIIAYYTWGNLLLQFVGFH